MSSSVVLFLKQIIGRGGAIHFAIPGILLGRDSLRVRNSHFKRQRFLRNSLHQHHAGCIRDSNPHFPEQFGGFLLCCPVNPRPYNCIAPAISNPLCSHCSHGQYKGTRILLQCLPCTTSPGPAWGHNQNMQYNPFGEIISLVLRFAAVPANV